METEKETLKQKLFRRSALIRTVALTLLCVLIGIVASMQYRTIMMKSGSGQSSEDLIENLIDTNMKLNAELDSAIREKEEVEERLKRVEQSSQDELLASLQSELDQVRTFAGLTAVKGSGVYVQVSFDETTNISLIQSRLLLLINELHASGAQAVSINGQRLVSMSEIRVVNSSYIAVNGEQLTAPYDIYAIGSAGKLLSGITMSGSGIVYQIARLTGTNCIWETQESILINACDENTIRIDRLQSQE